RAEVTRTAKIEAGAGIGWVALGGVSPFVDERSVQVKVTGAGARVLAARVRYAAHLERALGQEAIEALEQEAKQARRRAADADLAVDRAAQAERRAVQLLGSWVEAAAAAPRGTRRDEVLTSWREALASIERSQAEALAAAASAREARALAGDDLARAEA